MSSFPLKKRFKWDVKKLKPHFSISPEEGYIISGTEVALEVTYHPTEIGKESLYKNILCFIQGGNPLCLTLSGTCVGPPVVKEASRHCMEMDQRQVVSPTREFSLNTHIKPSVLLLPATGICIDHAHYLNNLSSLLVYLIHVLSSTFDSSAISSRRLCRSNSVVRAVSTDWSIAQSASAGPYEHSFPPRGAGRL